MVVKLNSVIETLPLLIFGHMNTSMTVLESRDTTALVISCTEAMTSWAFLQNTLMLRGPGVANFAGIVKIAIMLINTTFNFEITSNKQ